MVMTAIGAVGALASAAAAAHSIASSGGGGGGGGGGQQAPQASVGAPRSPVNMDMLLQNLMGQQGGLMPGGAPGGGGNLAMRPGLLGI